MAWRTGERRGSQQHSGTFAHSATPSAANSNAAMLLGQIGGTRVGVAHQRMAIRGAPAAMLPITDAPSQPWR
jgi:hypothetical protein